MTTTIYIGSGDGYVGYDETSTTFTAGVNAANGSAAVNGSDVINTAAYWQASNDRCQIYRGFLPVDTSPLGLGSVVTIAVLKIFVFTIFSGDPDANGHVGVYDASQTSTSTLVVGDYSEVGSTPFSNTIAFASLVDDAYNEFTLNASGLANIDVAGYSKFSTREGHDVADDAPADSTDNGISYRGSEQTGTSEDPKIEITYTPGATADNAIIMGTNF